MNETDIYLVDLATADIIRFPMLPEKISVEAGTRFASYDIMNIGEIKTPLGEELTKFSWEGVLPGEMRKNEPYVRGWKDPKGIQEKLSHFRNTGSRLQLIIFGTPIDHKVYLESYTIEYSGFSGDYGYSINFVHLKDLIISTEPPPTEAPKLPTSGDVSPNFNNKGIQKANENRQPNRTEGFYTVKSGDSLWRIAQSQMGDGSRYTEIAKLNGLKGTEILQPGQKLQLPDR